MSRSNTPRPTRRRAPTSRRTAHFFTYGENVGGPGWIVPLGGIPWQPTRPPVDHRLNGRPTRERPPASTTIATWENKGKNIDFGGETYVWSKHVNFLRFLDVPTRRPAMLHHGDAAADAARSRRRSRAPAGALIDPRPVSAGMESYAASSSAARAANSPSPRTSMSGRTAAGSATAASATSPPAGRW